MKRLILLGFVMLMLTMSVAMADLNMSAVDVYDDFNRADSSSLGNYVKPSGTAWSTFGTSAQKLLTINGSRMKGQILAGAGSGDLKPQIPNTVIDYDGEVFTIEFDYNIVNFGSPSTGMSMRVGKQSGSVMGWGFSDINWNGTHVRCNGTGTWFPYNNSQEYHYKVTFDNPNNQMSAWMDDIQICDDLTVGTAYTYSDIDIIDWYLHWDGDNREVYIDNVLVYAGTDAPYYEPTITYPNGGELFEDPSTIDINWTYPDGVGSFDLEYYDGASWNSIGQENTSFTLGSNVNVNIGSSSNSGRPLYVEKMNETHFWVFYNVNDGGDKNRLKLIDATDGSTDFQWDTPNLYASPRHLDETGAGSMHWDGSHLYIFVSGNYDSEATGKDMRVYKIHPSTGLNDTYVLTNTSNWIWAEIEEHNSNLYLFYKHNSTNQLYGQVIDKSFSPVTAQTFLLNGSAIGDAESDGTNMFVALYDLEKEAIYKFDNSLNVVSNSSDTDSYDIDIYGDQIATSNLQILDKSDFSVLYTVTGGTACAGSHTCFVRHTDYGYARYFYSGGSSSYNEYFDLYDETGQRVIPAQVSTSGSKYNGIQSGFDASNTYMVGITNENQDNLNYVSYREILQPENTYSWDVSSLDNGDEYLVRIKEGSSDYDESDATFTIDSLAGVSMVYPNGGETIAIGDTVLVNFTEETEGIDTRYDLEYSSNNGGAWSSLENDYNYYGSTESDPEVCSHQVDGWYEFHGMDDVDGTIYVSKNNNIWNTSVSSCDTTVHLTLTGSPCELSSRHQGLGTFIDPTTSDRKWLISCNSPNAVYQFNSTGAYEKVFGGCGGSFGGTGGIDCDDNYCYLFCNSDAGTTARIRKHYLNGTFIEEKTPPVTQAGKGGVGILEDGVLAYDSYVAGGYRYLNVLDWDTNTVTANSSVMTYPCPSGGYSTSDIQRVGNDVYFYSRYCDGSQANNDGNLIKFTFDTPRYYWDTTGFSMSDQYILRVRSEDSYLTSSWDESDAVFELRTYTAPTNPVVTYPNGGESLTETLVNLTYTESTDTENDTIHYELEYSNNSGSNWYPLVNDSASPYEWDLSSLDYASTYLWRLRACDDTAMCSSYDESDADFQFCIANWTCNLWGDCQTDDTRDCIEAIDQNTCGYNYTGDYSEFGTQACDYCTPSWYCGNLQLECPTDKTKECYDITDLYDCFATTGLPADDFNGSLSYYNEACGYDAVYSSNEITGMVVDTGASAGVEVIALMGVIVLAGVGGVIAMRLRKLGKI